MSKYENLNYPEKFLINGIKFNLAGYDTYSAHMNYPLFNVILLSLSYDLTCPERVP